MDSNSFKSDARIVIAEPFLLLVFVGQGHGGREGGRKPLIRYL